MDYKTAGVDILESDKLIRWLKSRSKPPFSSRVISGIGSYSGLFQAVFPNMKEPCLAASTDGVGTKLKLAVYFQRYKEVARKFTKLVVSLFKFIPRCPYYTTCFAFRRTGVHPPLLPLYQNYKY